MHRGDCARDLDVPQTASLVRVRWDGHCRVDGGDDLLCARWAAHSVLHRMRGFIGGLRCDAVAVAPVVGDGAALGVSATCSTVGMSLVILNAARDATESTFDRRLSDALWALTVRQHVVDETVLEVDNRTSRKPTWERR